MNDKVENPLNDAISRIMLNPQNSKDVEEEHEELVDIISFCNKEQYLNLPSEGMELYPSQRVILKCFYKKTPGNENIDLTEDEWNWLYENEEEEVLDGVKYENNIKDVIRKMLKRDQDSDMEVFSYLHLVLGRRASKCRYENDLIPTTEGSLTLRELCDRWNNGEKIGILTYNQETLKKEKTYDIKVKDNGIVDCYQIKTKRGIKEISSWNHPYLVWRNEKPEFIYLKDLRIGDKIAVADNTELFGKGSIGVNKAALLGHFQGNGNTIPKSILEGSKEEVSAFLNRFFGCAGCVFIRKNGKSGKINVSLRSEKLIDQIRHLLLKYGIHATVRGPYLVEGKFKNWKLDIKRKKDIINFYENIGISSKQDKLKELVQIVIERTDKEYQVFDNIPKQIYTSIRSDIKEKKVSINSIIGNKNRRLRSQYSLNRNDALVIGENLNNKFVKDMADSDVRWDEVKSVIHIGALPTVDLEVNPHHTIGGDIISHNTVMASIITAYEAYKLLVINGGDPHKHYGLPNDDEIAIINVALSQQQAGRLFGQIQTRIRNSPFLKKRLAKETSSEIRLYTNKDLEKIQQFKEEGVKVNVPGSILLLCGHSKPDSLRGYSAIMLLFDEIAFYDESGKVTGKFFFNSLKPALSKFFKYDAGKIVMISSPHVRNGIFYETGEAAKEDDGILSFQLPTWRVNPEVPYDQKELVRDRKSNPEMFAIEYGAQWASGGTYGNYFESELIERCIRTDITPHLKPQSGFNYYLHIDPAKNNNNYAACLVAMERYINARGQKRKRCILAGTWIWRPVPGMGLVFNEIDREVLGIARLFRPMTITYDTFNSKHSIELLRSSGFNCRELSYNRGVKTKIYQNLKDLMLYQPYPELQIYPHGGEADILIQEMKELKYKSLKRGYTLLPDKNGEVGTDDLLDCLSGACYMASEGHRESLPAPVTVRMGYY